MSNRCYSAFPICQTAPLLVFITQVQWNTIQRINGSGGQDKEAFGQPAGNQEELFHSQKRIYFFVPFLNETDGIMYLQSVNSFVICSSLKRVTSISFITRI